jgi:hypothetical protein
MPRILLDQNAPRGLRAALSEHEVQSALQVGWATLANGDLIASAEAAGFDILITADQSIRYQQNLAERRLALIVLSTNHWSIIRLQIESIRHAVGAAYPGAYVELQFELSPLHRHRSQREG